MISASQWTSIRQMLTTVLIVYVIWLLGLWALQRRIIYPGFLRLPEPEPTVRVSGLELWWLDTEDGPVEAWWLPGYGVSENTPGPVMMSWHGNGAFIDDVLLQMMRYRTLGISILLIEYRGYGRSAGVPSEEGIMADANNWRWKLLKRKEVDRNRFIFHGRSLGSGPAVHMAAQHQPEALVLEAPIPSLRPFFATYLAPSFLLRDTWDNINVAPTVKTPSIVFHGKKDETVPYHYGERLAKALKARLVPYVNTGHNDLPPDAESHFEKVAGFLQGTGILTR